MNMKKPTQKSESKISGQIDCGNTSTSTTTTWETSEIQITWAKLRRTLARILLYSPAQIAQSCWKIHVFPVEAWFFNQRTQSLAQFFFHDGMSLHVWHCFQEQHFFHVKLQTNNKRQFEELHRNMSIRTLIPIVKIAYMSNIEHIHLTRKKILHIATFYGQSPIQENGISLLLPKKHYF